MRIFISLGILFTLAITLALFAQFNQGIIVLFYPPYRIDLSLNLALIFLLASFLGFYFLIRLVLTLATLPQRAHHYRETQEQRQANEAFREAWISLISGRFLRAEKMAKKAQIWPEIAQMAALIGARAAHGMHELERRNHWLDQIHHSKLQQARNIVNAEMLLESRDPLGALDTLNQLETQGGRQIHAKRIALRAHQQLKNYAEVLRLVRLLEKRHALHPTLIRSTKQQACEALLKERRHDADALLVFWQTLPITERCLPHNANIAARLLLLSQRYHPARLILELSLKETWEPSLLMTYAECASKQSSALPLITQVESWLRTYPREAALHYALGRLCWHQQLWGKAQSSLENCLVLSKEDRAMQSACHLALAQLNESLERYHLAHEHYRTSALLQADQTLPKS